MNLVQVLYLLGNISIISCLVIFIYFPEKNKPLKKFFFPGILLKILAGVGLGLIYQHYYAGAGDTFFYYKDAKLIGSLLNESPVLYFNALFLNDFPEIISPHLSYLEQPRALLMAKLISPLAVLTNNNYFIIGAYLSLFSFIGMWKLANRLAIYYPKTKKAAAIAFLFFPSVIFWSSGVMKESIIMGIIGFIGAAYLHFYHTWKRPATYKIFLYSLGIILLMVMKYYYAALLIPLMVTALATKYISENNPLIGAKFRRQLLAWFGIFIGMVLLATNLHPNLGVDAFMKALVLNHNIIFEVSRPETLVYYNNLRPELMSLIINTPIALMAGLFRPLLWDSGEVFQIIASVENLILVFLFAFSMPGIRKFFILKDSEKILIFSVVVYIILLAILMAFASPNFGSLMRYKVGFLPFFVYLLLISKPLEAIESQEPLEVKEGKMVMN
jgi:hypothetical protein